MTEYAFLEELDHLLLEELTKLPELESFAEKDLSETIENTVLNSKVELSQLIYKSLKKNAPKMLKKRRKDLRGFESRNFKRWEKAFDKFELMIVLATELGECNDKEQRSQAAQDEDFEFEAIAHLHPRALLIAQEVLCLLKGGYPDGALARWRSLHEVNITAMFIAKHGQEIALNYLASFPFNARRAAYQLNEYADRASLEHVDKEQLEVLDRVCNAAEQQAGRSIGANLDWAKPAISKKMVTFFDLEKDVGMDQWRPNYRWSSQHTHAGHRPADNLLGMSEAQQKMLLVGPSNSGFVDPLHMTAISLVQMTTTMLLRKSNFSRIVYSDIMVKLSDEIGSMAEEASAKEAH